MSIPTSAPKYVVEEDWHEFGFDAWKFWAVNRRSGATLDEKICECHDEANAHMIAEALNKFNKD
jgi:hypothetical protein